MNARRTIARRGMLFAALALLVSITATLLIAGCNPYNGPVAAEWSAPIEAAWQRATSCWSFEPADRPRVIVQDCTLDEYGHLSWDYRGTLVRGLADTNNYAALTCADFAHLDHEFSHLVLYRMGRGTGVEDYFGAIPGNCFGVADTRGRGPARREESRGGEGGGEVA